MFHLVYAGFFSFLLSITSCFNFDVNQVVTKKIGNKDGLFGFSVSPHYINKNKAYRYENAFCESVDIECN